MLRLGLLAGLLMALAIDPLAAQQAKGYLNVNGDEIRLTRKGLLQADTLLPEYFELGLGLKQWIAFPRDRFDQCGFPAAIWSKNGNMFSCLDAEAELL